MKQLTFLVRRTDFRLVAAGACVTALLVLAGGCSQAEKEKEPVVSVQTTPAEKKTISQIVTSEALVFPLQQATIAPKISSTIAEFKVQRGSHVQKGQLLVVLENKDLAAAAEASKGDFEVADAAYATTVGAGLPQQIQKAELDAASAKSAFEAQQKVYDSRKALFQEGAIPRRDLDSAEVALTQARSQSEQSQRQVADLHRIGKEQALKSARGSRESAEGHYRAASAQLSYSEIRSPIDGVVTDRPLFVGDQASANQPILTLMNISTLIAKAHIPQSQAAQLKVGDAAEIKVAGLDEPVKGRVSLVSPALDTGSTTIEVWVEVRKPDPALKPGMTVDLSMTAKTAKDAIVVPASAVYKNPDGADFVLIAGSDKHAHTKVVQVGIRNGALAQILNGINAGDAVITTGGYALADNTQITIETPATAEKDASDKTDKAGDSAKPASKDKE
jgi:HlyD family secretion protein